MYLSPCSTYILIWQYLCILQYDPNKDVNNELEIQIHSLELFRNTHATPDES